METIWVLLGSTPSPHLHISKLQTVMQCLVLDEDTYLAMI